MYARIGRRAFAPALVCVSLAAGAADGDLDTTYGDDGFRLSGIADAVSLIPAGMVMQPDGKVLTCVTEGISPNEDFYVARFTAEGDLDASFSFDGRTTIDFGGHDDVCTGIAVQADGKIVVSGTTVDAPAADFAIARLNADGTLDTAGFGAGTGKSVVGFDLGGTEYDAANGIAIKPDGKIVLVGYATTDTNGTDFAVLQLNSDGTRDTSFNLTGRVTIGFNLPDSTTNNDTAIGVAIDTAGRIVVVGNVTGSGTNPSDFAVARLLPNGTPDADFSADGKTTVAFDLGGTNDDEAASMTLQRDGRIVIVGEADSSTNATPNFDWAIARLLPDGSPDTSFGFGGRATIAFDLAANGQDLALGAAEQSNGRIVLAGAAVISASSIMAISARLLPNGLPDTSFGTLGKKIYDFGQTTPSGQLFNGVAMTADNRIVFSGVLNVIDSLHADVFTARALNDLLFASGFE